MTEVDPAMENELLGAGGGHDFHDGASINEEELLGDGPAPEIKEEPVGEGHQDDDVDLFDEAVAPSQLTGEKRTSSTTAATPTTVILRQELPSLTPTFTASAASSTSSLTGKFACYIGNLTWWTTDADLLVNIAALGIQDILEVKFFENRTNGQSKGFALCTFGSDTSLKNVLENIQNRPIHGAKPAGLQYTKQNLAKLEDVAAKTQTRPDIKKKEDQCLNMGTIRIGTGPPPGMMRGAGAPSATPLMAPLPLVINGQPAMQPQMMARTLGPPGVGMPQMTMQPTGPPRPLMPAMQGGPPQPLMGMRAPVPYGAPQPLMGSLRPGSHVNPALFPMAAPVPEAEFEEIMNRNRTVSSSAIQRAMSDAHAGDVKAAVETLHTAITLIRSSRVAHDERCRMLIAQLEDTLRAVDSKGSYRSSGGSSRSRDYRDSRRSRSRSRSRDRKRRRRSRSTSRSRSPARHRSRY